MFIAGLGSVARVSLPVLEQVEIVRVDDGAHLEELRIGQFGNVRGVRQLTLVGLTFTDDAFVTLPSQVSGSTSLINSGERSLRVLSGLAVTGALQIRGNDQLVTMGGCPASPAGTCARSAAT